MIVSIRHFVEYKTIEIDILTLKMLW